MIQLIPFRLTTLLTQNLLEREQENSSLQHKLSLAEADVEKYEDQIKNLKNASEEGETHKTTGENLARKVQLLEEELDKAEKDLKDTTEKLRLVDVKAEDFERRLQSVQQERDQWEQKYEEVSEKLRQSKKELDELVGQMESLVSFTQIASDQSSKIRY
uniref:Actin lateral binding protein n=1 Tax=Kwoniella pini CBS 10737 TaxID=1296096 RepID=A0A1B9HZ62_9TREE|nr:actin lateral binding protein [Kwoniella pini CBS 10737]OCF48556.1 actin lateral binding protein [Kwoniella pini CBS 10737]